VVPGSGPAVVVPRGIPQAELGSPPGERRDAAENRKRVLDAARALFAERGVDAASMHDVAQAAGIGQGTLYRRFPNKATLCEALLAHNLWQFHDAVVARLDQDEGPVLGQLRWFVDALLAFVEGNGPLVRAMGDSACGATPEDHYQHPWTLWQRGVMAALLERAAARGEIAPTDVEATADVVLAACDPPLYLHQRQQRGYSRERIVGNLMRLLAGPAWQADALPAQEPR
jgi:AcrR family transcriptional regulator